MHPPCVVVIALTRLLRILLPDELVVECAHEVPSSAIAASDAVGGSEVHVEHLLVRAHLPKHVHVECAEALLASVFHAADLILKGLCVRQSRVHPYLVLEVGVKRSGLVIQGLLQLLLKLQDLPVRVYQLPLLLIRLVVVVQRLLKPPVEELRLILHTACLDFPFALQLLCWGRLFALDPRRLVPGLEVLVHLLRIAEEHRLKALAQVPEVDLPYLPLELPLKPFRVKVVEVARVPVEASAMLVKRVLA